MKKWMIMLTMLLAFGMLCGCTYSTYQPVATSESFTLEEATAEQIIEEDSGLKTFTSSYTEGQKPKATITVAGFGDIVVELDPVNAPQTVENFVTLAKDGFYDGLTFHRIYQNFMIQGGDPDGNGTGGPGYSIFGEFSGNGWDNKLSHVRGTISMARSSAPDSAGSQFFICDADDEFLDGQYAAFGMVVEGMDVLDAVAAVETVYGMSGEKSTPVESVIIEKITIAD